MARKKVAKKSAKKKAKRSFKVHGPKQHEIKWYGYRRDMRDPRDHEFLSATEPLPVVDLRSHCPPHMDQGALGSCVAHGVTGVTRYLRKVSGKPDHTYSRLQLYYDGRVVEGTVSEDSGLEIRDAIKCIAQLGCGHETLWRYTISKFKSKPPQRVYTDALKYQALEYKRVPVTADAVKTALSEGHPVIIGITVFASFESDSANETGMIPMPDIKNEELLGGHCMYVVGYGQKEGHFTVRNSWGNSWGDGGDCYIPYEYIGSSKLGGDYWIITKAEE